MTETAEEQAKRTRAEQGLPPKITELAYYERVAGYVDMHKRERRAA